MKFLSFLYLTEVSSVKTAAHFVESRSKVSNIRRKQSRRATLSGVLITHANIQ